MASTLDSLRYTTSLYREGVAILLDDWSPRHSKNGRGNKPGADELKALFSTTSRQIYTRFGDTTLPAGPRLTTSNAETLQEWRALLDERHFTEMTDAQRCSGISADAMALYKRLAFATVTAPLLSRGAVEAHDDGTTERATKRAKTAISMFWGQDVE